MSHKNFTQKNSKITLEENIQDNEKEKSIEKESYNYLILTQMKNLK